MKMSRNKHGFPRNFKKASQSRVMGYWDRKVQQMRYPGYMNRSTRRSARRHGAENIQRAQAERDSRTEIDRAIALERDHPEKFESGEMQRFGARFRINR